MVDGRRKTTVRKSCKYGGYGSLEHLLFLFSFSIAVKLLQTIVIGKGCEAVVKKISQVTMCKC